MPHYKVLVIDYEPRGIRQLRDPLQSVGYRVTVANDGDLLVIEAGTGRLLKVAPDSGQMMVVMENLSAAFSSQLLTPVAQVAQSSDGAIYVSEPGASSFSVIRPRR